MSYHKTLQRQISKFLVDTNNIPKNLQDLLQTISETYLHHDEDRTLIERSLELSSKELEEFNKQLQSESEIIEKEVEKRTQELSAERNKLAIILSGIIDSIIAVDLQKKIILFNKAAENLTGYKTVEVIGKPIDVVIKVFDQSQELIPLYYCPIRTDGFEGEIFKKQGLRVIGQNGKESFVNLIAGQIREGAQVNLGCILTFHDKTQEKRLEEMKIDFISMAAHELRTPLTSIRGYLSVFIKENKDKLNADQKSLLDHLSSVTERFALLISDLLSVSNMEKGSFSISKEPIQWSTFVQQSISELEQRARDKQVQLTFLDSLVKPTVQIDKLRMGEVLSNLISNAIIYTNAGGTVKVWIGQKDNNITTFVQDTGVGIPATAIPHLFTKFYRVSTSLQQGIKGTGLGLYISKVIVEKHGGSIWVNSEVSKGSTFAFSLPIQS